MTLPQSSAGMKVPGRRRSWSDQEMDPGLARPRPVPFVHPSWLKRLLGRALDAVGGWLQPAAKDPIDFSKAHRVAVLRMDHLGDLLLAFPALAALRAALPQATIDLYTGSWTAELASWCPSVDHVEVADAPWFQRGGRRRSTLAAIWSLGRRLRAGRYDLVIELRGELRQLAAARLSGAPCRLGHTQGLGSFLLSHRGRWDDSLHESEQSLGLLRQAGLPGVPPIGQPRPALKLPEQAHAQAELLMARWSLPKGFLALHPSAGAPSRQWPLEHWAQFIQGLPAEGPILLLGSKDEKGRVEELIRLSGRKGSINAAGETDLASLAGLLAQAGQLVCMDSGPSHLAAALGTPVLALFSYANVSDRWIPQGPKVQILKSPVPCGPCELAVCPYDNECLHRLTPQRALAALASGTGTAP